MKKKIIRRKKNLWAGRFKKKPSKSMLEINASIDFDKNLYRQDIQASKAHAIMLSNQKIITKRELNKILSGLDIIEGEIKLGKIKFLPELEDIHTHIEARLIEIIGTTAKKLHTARSRNDQVITDLRLWVKDERNKLDQYLKNLQEVLIKKAEKHYEDLMPGFTHLQPAQPITLGHHLLAYVNMFGRDREHNQDLERHHYSPLGSAALAGTSFNINRNETASRLGFRGVMNNSIDAVSDRDFILDMLNLCCSISIHMSRVSEEIILWSSPGFNFVRLSDEYSTGSSIMPQKKNPDAAELIRGKSGRIIGNYVALFNTLKALPLAYSKDMQEDKEPLFDSIKQIKICLKVLSEMFNSLSFQTNNMRKMCQKGYLTATDLADWLVKEKGLTFRDAHNATGKIVALAEQKKLQLSQLSIKDLKKIEKKINKNIFDVIELKSSVNSRKSLGGTAIENVRREIILAKERWL